MEDTTFIGRLRAELDGEVDDLPDLFATYSRSYTGSRFEHLADDDLDTITSNDLIAVSSLGVDVPGRVAIWVLGEGRNETSALLRMLPADVDLWDAGELIERDHPLWQLWDLIRTRSWPQAEGGNGMGPTRTSKLLAAKRPRLVPIIDSVVKRVLPSKTHWADFAAALSEDGLRRRIEDATRCAPGHLSLLRKIDIAIWMRHHEASRTR